MIEEVLYTERLTWLLACKGDLDATTRDRKRPPLDIPTASVVEEYGAAAQPSLWHDPSLTQMSRITASRKNSQYAEH